MQRKDALNYCDQVKAEFRRRPEVYTRFICTLKAFRMSIIDTPNVIDRVCDLVAGHRELILGFSIFLPAGVHMERGTDDDLNAIRVDRHLF
ncbi:hypothetical protein BDV97DRAFT_347674 [Delphinella strobiligena]|nr:hypothetical protein BDV97DRAFT_347674 [Delphinella strobiligena]